MSNITIENLLENFYKDLYEHETETTVMVFDAVCKKETLDEIHDLIKNRSKISEIIVNKYRKLNTELSKDD